MWHIIFMRHDGLWGLEANLGELEPLADLPMWPSGQRTISTA